MQTNITKLSKIFYSNIHIIFISSALEANEYSDLDLAYDESIEKADLLKIETLLTESDLPYKVDIIDLKKISTEFYDAIKQDLQPFKLT